MLITDFKDYRIDNFTPAEIEDTGANLKDVQKETIISIQKFRIYIRRRVKLLRNGITTGRHKASEHPRGLAIDGYLLPEDGFIDVHLIFKGALEAGFRGIGIYWNQVLYSFHLDLRKIRAHWCGVKDTKRGINTWQFYSLLNDPAKIRLRNHT